LIFEILIVKFLANFFYILRLDLVCGTAAAELSRLTGLTSLEHWSQFCCMLLLTLPLTARIKHGSLRCWLI